MSKDCEDDIVEIPESDDEDEVNVNALVEDEAMEADPISDGSFVDGDDSNSMSLSHELNSKPIDTKEDDDDDVVEISDDDDDCILEEEIDGGEKIDESILLEDDDDGPDENEGESNDEDDEKTQLISKNLQMNGHSGNVNGKDTEDDDIVEISDADPLGGGNSGDAEGTKTQKAQVKTVESIISVQELNPETKKEETSTEEKSTIVVSDAKSLADLANDKSEPEAKKEPTLVIIDTNSIMSGKGVVPAVKQIPRPFPNGNDHNVKSNMASLIPRKLMQIPDNAFLIEAPSFIVPYVFEQSGESQLKKHVDHLEELVKKEKAEKMKDKDKDGSQEKSKEPEPRKPEVKSEDYFVSPVGKLLMTIGMNLVQEYVQTDLLKMQRRKAEKEREKTRSNILTMETQQGLIALRKNLDESKENNEPFRFSVKKCELCNFKTESKLVMSTHLETPHMRNYSYRCNFCTYTTRVPQEILFHMEAEHNVKARLER